MNRLENLQVSDPLIPDALEGFEPEDGYPRQMGRRDFLKLVGAAILSSITSCGLPSPEELAPAELSPAQRATEIALGVEPTVAPTEELTIFVPTGEPTLSPEPVVASEAQSTPTPERPKPGGAYDDNFMARIEAGEFSAQEGELEALIENYWVPEGTFSSDAELYYKYYVDEADGGIKVVLETEDYPNSVFSSSLDPEGKPLQLTITGPIANAPDISEDSRLVSYNGEWVRMMDDGQIVGKINPETGQWERVAPEIPPAPEGADAEIWQAGCLAGLNDEFIQEYDLTPQWDEELGTVVWYKQAGNEIGRAYNTEFGFMGEVVGQGERREIVSHALHYSPTKDERGTEIFAEHGERLGLGFHLGEQVDYGSGAEARLVDTSGMIVGVREKVDFSQFMMDPASYPEELPFGIEPSGLTQWEALRIRSEVKGEQVEFLLLVNPVGYPDYKIGVPGATPRGKEVSIDEFWSQIEVGSEFYARLAVVPVSGDKEEWRDWYLSRGNYRGVIGSCIGRSNLPLMSVKKLGIDGSSELSYPGLSELPYASLFPDNQQVQEAVNTLGPILTMGGIPQIGGAHW